MSTSKSLAQMEKSNDPKNEIRTRRYLTQATLCQQKATLARAPYSKFGGNFPQAGPLLPLEDSA